MIRYLPLSSCRRAICAAAVAVLLCNPSRADAAPPAPSSTEQDGDAVLATVDWTALALGEFAVGGSLTSVYAHCIEQLQAVGDCETCEKCGDDCCDEPADNGSVADVASAIDSPRPWRHVPPTTNRPSLAATEILKLRRAVGVNPIAGTMFDAPPAPGVSCSDRELSLDDATMLTEQAIAEVIRRLETEQPAVDDVPAPLEGWRGGEESCGTELTLMRPAERKLEEAAELLEQLGEYERADMARDLAFQTRQQARQIERRQRRLWLAN